MNMPPSIQLCLEGNLQLWIFPQVCNKCFPLVLSWEKNMLTWNTLSTQSGLVHPLQWGQSILLPAHSGYFQNRISCLLLQVHLLVEKQTASLWQGGIGEPRLFLVLPSVICWNEVGEEFAGLINIDYCWNDAPCQVTLWLHLFSHLFLWLTSFSCFSTFSYWSCSHSTPPSPHLDSYSKIPTGHSCPHLSKLLLFSSSLEIRTYTYWKTGIPPQVLRTFYFWVPNKIYTSTRSVFPAWTIKM